MNCLISYNFKLNVKSIKLMKKINFKFKINQFLKILNI